MSPLTVPIYTAPPGFIHANFKLQADLAADGPERFASKVIYFRAVRVDGTKMHRLPRSIVLKFQQSSGWMMCGVSADTFIETVEEVVQIVGKPMARTQHTFESSEDKEVGEFFTKMEFPEDVAQQIFDELSMRPFNLHKPPPKKPLPEPLPKLDMEQEIRAHKDWGTW
jgi:hypothetical protein